METNPLTIKINEALKRTRWWVRGINIEFPEEEDWLSDQKKVDEEEKEENGGFGEIVSTQNQF